MGYSVAANTATSPRTGSLVVAGQLVTVTQAAATTVATCTYSVSPVDVSMSGTGGVGSSTVMSAVGCGWSARSNASWIVITGGSSGSGAGAVYYSVDSNRTRSTRTGTIAVAGQTITITQSRRRR